MRRALQRVWGKLANIAQLRRHPARVIVFVIAFVGVLAVAAMPLLAQADSNLIAGFIGTILSFFVRILGKLLLLIVYILTQVAQYNDFINSTAVSNGWVIVRDVANMFFIVILLITAFATILNVESYQWKQILPKLLTAAILINFSKTIAGIFIDISQVVMLTFVNGFAAAAGGNFTSAFQISNLLDLDVPGQNMVDIAAVLGGYVLALLMLVIAIGVTVIMTIMLLFRIVMLWTLVVLSPLPYLLRVIPGKGSGMADRWWKDFSENLIAGPVLAFFLWLALVSVGSGSVAQNDKLIDKNHVGGDVQVVQGGATIPNPGGTTAGTPEPFLSFLVAVCMLIAGTKIAGEYSVTGASALNKFREKLGQKGMGALKTVTGAKYAEALYKIRQGRKEERFQEGVAKWQGRIGMVQQGIGTGLKYGVGGLGVGAGHVAFGRRAEAAEDQAKTLSQEAAQARDAGDHTGAVAKEQAAATERARAASLRKKQRWTERGVNAAIIGGLMPATGGLSALAIPGMFGRGVQDAGKKNVSDAQQYTYKKVNAERDAVKNLKPEDILKKAQGGPDVSKFEQMAAMITAVEKQLVSGSDLPKMKDKMGSLGADAKTMSTFESMADQKYPGTRLASNPAERRRQLASGRINMKDLTASELADPGFAADIALNVSQDSQKEIGKTKASKAAYAAGLEGAIAKAVGDLGKLTPGTNDHTEKQKQLSQYQAKYVQFGGDIKKAFAGPAVAGGVPAIDYAAFGQVMTGKGGGEIVANMDVTLMADTNIVQQLADNADPVQIQYALKKAVDDGDRDRAKALRKLVNDVRTQLQTDTAGPAPAAGPALDTYQDKKQKLQRLRDRTFRI